MVSVNNVKKATSLLRKELGIEISKFSKEGIKDIKVPKEAVTYDAVKVGREANPAAHNTDVYIFRDENGKVVSTIHNRIDNGKISQTVKKYSPQTEDNLCIDTEEYFDVIPIKRQLIRGYEKVNGKYTKCFEEHRALSDDKEMMESLRREVQPGSNEIIKVSHFEKGAKPKYVENHYEKQSINQLYQFAPEIVKSSLLKKAITEPTKYAGSYILKDSKVSDETLKELATHEHFLPYFSPDNKFIYRMSRQVEKEKDALNRNQFVYPYSEKSKRGGFCKQKGFDYIIGINRLNKNGSARTRTDIANAIGHEFGHANWEEKVTEYEVFGDIVEETSISKNKIEKIKKYKTGSENYTKAEDDINKYKENYTEILARQEGRETSDKYDELDRIVNEQFPTLQYVYKKDLNAEVETSSYFFNELIHDMKYKDILK